MNDDIQDIVNKVARQSEDEYAAMRRRADVNATLKGIQDAAGTYLVTYLDMPTPQAKHTALLIAGAARLIIEQNL